MNRMIREDRGSLKPAPWSLSPASRFALFRETTSHAPLLSPLPLSRLSSQLFFAVFSLFSARVYLHSQFHVLLVLCQS